MKSISVDARMYLASGIGTYLRNLLKAFAHYSEFSLHVITTQEILNKAPELQKFEISLIKAGVYSLKEQIELPLNIPCCDLFWSPNFNVPLLTVRARKKVVTIHDVFYLAHSSSLPFHKKHYARFVTKKAARQSNLVITDSDFSKGEICRYTGISEGKIKRIHLGVDHQFFSDPLSREEEQKILKKYVPPKQFFLYVGNLKSHKNLLRLLEAYKRWLEEKGTEVHLILIGKSFSDCPVYETIKNIPQFKGQVHLYNSVENRELIWFYSNAQATVLPSLYEGFGFPPLEAMCCGCPTIVSTAASLPEICGDASYYIDPTDINSMVQGLENIIEDQPLRKSLSEKGYRRVKEFQWNKAFEEHIQAFEQVIHTP